MFIPSVMLGVAWKPLCDSVGRLGWLPGGITVFLGRPGIPVAMGLTWAMQALWHIEPGGECGQIGDQAFRWSFIGDRAARVWQTATEGGFPLSFALWALAWGVAVGLVLVIESVSTLPQSKPVADFVGPPTPPWVPGAADVRLRRQMTAITAANVVLAAAAAAPASLSRSRTVAAESMGASGPLAPLAHGIALLLIVTVAAPWLAQIPRLAAAVALTLVAVQMIGTGRLDFWTRPTAASSKPLDAPADNTQSVSFWSQAHDPAATPDRIGAGFALIGIAAMSLWVGSAVWGLVFGAAIWGLSHIGRRRSYA